jgi:GAF domain-containing protein
VSRLAYDLDVNDEGTRLASTFAHVARKLLAEHDLDSILREILAVALAEVGACEGAGIDLIEKRVVRPIASSSDMAQRIARIQNEVGEGPCLSAIREHETFRTDDLEADPRWPKFAVRASAETNVRSILGFRLFAEEDTMGALNLYSSRTAAFDDKAVAIGSILAAHAAIAMSSARERDYMHTALENRDVIGQAKGILMSRDGIDADAAFEVLREASQRLNVKIREVADQVIGSFRGAS